MFEDISAPLLFEDSRLYLGKLKCNLNDFFMLHLLYQGDSSIVTHACTCTCTYVCMYVAIVQL